MQTAGHLVAVAAKFSSGMENRQHHFDRRPAALVHVDGNAPAVIDDGNTVVGVNRYRNLTAISGERFVDRIINDFINKVMKAALRCAADIHAGALADRFEPFQNLNLIGVIRAFNSGNLRARLIRMNFHVLRIRRDIIRRNRTRILFVIDHLVITLQRLVKSSFPFTSKRNFFYQRPVRNSARFFRVNGDIADR